MVAVDVVSGDVVAGAKKTPERNNWGGLPYVQYCSIPSGKLT